MKAFATTLTLLASLALSMAAALADEDARGPGKGGGNSGRGAVGGMVGGADVRAPGAEINVNRGRADGDRGNVGVNIDRGRVGANIYGDRRGYSNYRDQLGARDFDRRGIGVLDTERFNNRNDSRWRYARWHDRWWYWQPAGYWVWWNGDRWNRYDVNTYVDEYVAAEPQGAAVGASGPYYEDANGFFYYENGRKVYDPQIERISTAASRPGGPTR